MKRARCVKNNNKMRQKKSRINGIQKVEDNVDGCPYKDTEINDINNDLDLNIAGTCGVHSQPSQRWTFVKRSNRNSGPFTSTESVVVEDKYNQAYCLSLSEEKNILVSRDLNLDKSGKCVAYLQSNQNGPCARRSSKNKYLSLPVVPTYGEAKSNPKSYAPLPVIASSTQRDECLVSDIEVAQPQLRKKVMRMVCPSRLLCNQKLKVNDRLKFKPMTLSFPQGLNTYFPSNSFSVIITEDTSVKNPTVARESDLDESDFSADEEEDSEYGELFSMNDAGFVVAHIPKYAVGA